VACLYQVALSLNGARRLDRKLLCRNVFDDLRRLLVVVEVAVLPVHDGLCIAGSGPVSGLQSDHLLGLFFLPLAAVRLVTHPGCTLGRKRFLVVVHRCILFPLDHHHWVALLIVRPQRLIRLRDVDRYVVVDWLLL
jgi:hypothetical protein